MNKAKIIATATKKTTYARWEVEKIFDPIFETILEALAAGEQVTIQGFGTFKRKTVKARTGYNPQTRQPIEIPEKEKIVFQPSAKIATKQKVLSPEDVTAKK